MKRIFFLLASHFLSSLSLQRHESLYIRQGEGNTLLYEEKQRDLIVENINQKGYLCDV